MTTVAVSLETQLWSWIARIEDGSERSASARAASPSRQCGDEDERLLAARAANDADAFATLYRRYVQRIHAFVFRRSQNHDLAEDVTAATFERALRSIESFRWRGPGSFAAWLHRIASNLLIDHYRAEARRAPLTVVDAGGEADSFDADGTEDIARVRTALTHLRPRYQEVIQLRFFSDLDRDAAAAALGCSLSTLSVLQHRAVRALAKAMEATP